VTDFSRQKAHKTRELQGQQDDGVDDLISGMASSGLSKDEEMQDWITGSEADADEDEEMGWTDSDADSSECDEMID
jgi:hypothetical protein